MQSGKIITLSVWLMIFFNLLLAFGSVWSFQRMNPEIKRIYERNVVSLRACEEMLMALADERLDRDKFRLALQTAENNITESGEREVLSRIHAAFEETRQGVSGLRPQIISDIIKLTDFNRQAIIQSALQAQKLRQAGAWGIVFMTLIFFTAAIFLEQRLRRTLLLPLQEISQVMEAYRQGDQFRRCNMLYANAEMKKLFTALNALLDRRN